MSANAFECVVDGKPLTRLRAYQFKSDAFSKVYRDSGLYRCDHCGLAQAATGCVDGARLRTYYQSQYRDVAEIASVKSGASRDFFKARGAALADLIETVPVRVFEMGCGYGYNLAAVKARFAEAVTCSDELDETVELPPFIAKADISDGGWDVVILSHVLEHFADPLGMLRTIKRALAAGGQIIVEVPNEEGDPRVAGPDEPHLTFYTTKTLRSIAEAAGLQVTSLYTAGPANPSPHQASSARAIVKRIALAVPGIKAMRARNRPVRDGSTDLVTHRQNGMYLRAVLRAG